MRGKVFLVGAGPGDPELITRRGFDLLAQAEVVVVDALVNPALFKSLKARVIHVGKRGPGAPSGSSRELPQSKINELLVRLVRAGKTVVRLKGGDPFLFGRGSEEVDALRRVGAAYEVVPGVSSATAVPTRAGIPITDRRFASQVTFITGQSKEEKGRRSPRVDWKSLSPRQTLVVLMGVSRWPRIRQRLLDEGWPPEKPVAAIERGTTPYERVIACTLEESAQKFQKEKLTAPAIIVVGDVVRLRQRFTGGPTAAKPLLGKRVIVTRPLDQSAEMVALLKKKGAEVLLSPSIRVEPLRLRPRLKQSKYDWIIFLSVNAVKTFVAPAIFKPGPRFSPGANLGPGQKHAGATNILAVGPETKRIAQARGWRVHKIPSQFNSTGVLAALGDVRGKRILIPRVQSAPQDLVKALRRRGGVVEEVVTYRTVGVSLSAKMKRELKFGVDALTFTSSSTADNFFKRLPASAQKEIRARTVAFSIGPQTSATLRENGVHRVIEAEDATVKHLVDSLCQYFGALV